MEEIEFVNTFAKGNSLPTDQLGNMWAIILFLYYFFQKQQLDVVKEQVNLTQIIPVKTPTESIIFDNLPLINSTQTMSLTTFYEDLLCVTNTQDFTIPSTLPYPSTMINLHDFFISNNPTLLFVPLSPHGPTLAILISSVPNLTYDYGQSSQE